MNNNNLQSHGVPEALSKESSLPQRTRPDERIALPSRPAHASIFGMAEDELALARELTPLIRELVGFRTGEERPSKATIDKIKYIFDVVCELRSIGAPLSVVVEVIGHPIIAPLGQSVDPDERRGKISAFLDGFLKESPILTAENKLSIAPLGSVNYRAFGIPFEDVPDWDLVRQTLIAPIRAKLLQNPDFCPTYSDAQVSLIREGSHASMQSLLDQGTALQIGPATPTDIWNTLYHRLEIGLLLIVTRKAPEVIVAGLLHDERELWAPQAWVMRKNEIESLFGRHIASLTDAIGINPVASNMRPSTATRQMFEEPELVRAVEHAPPEIRAELKTLVSAKALSVIGSNVMSAINAVTTEEAPLQEKFEYPSCDTGTQISHQWGKRLSQFVAYRDCIHSDRTFRSSFESMLSAWVNASHYLPRSTDLLKERIAFNLLLPRTKEFRNFLSPADEKLGRPQVAFVSEPRELLARTFTEQHHDNLIHSLIRSYHLETQDMNGVAEALAIVGKSVGDIWHSENSNSSPPVNVTPNTYSVEEITLIGLALNYCADLLYRPTLTNVVRAPSDQLKHIAEVGYLLMRCGSEVEVVIAGLLHDIYEVTPTDALLEERERIVRMFGPLGGRIDALIAVVTEPPKSSEDEHDNYIARKTKVVAGLVELKETDISLARGAAAIVCAAKMSTMRDGYLFGANFITVQPWTKGSWTENTRAMCTLHDMFDELAIDPALLGAYRLEFTKWVNLSNEVVSTIKPPPIKEETERKLIWKDGVPYFQEEKSDLRRYLTELHQEVLSFHSKKIESGKIDTRKLIVAMTAAMEGMSPLAMPTDPEHSTLKELHNLINESGRRVFMPRGVFLAHRSSWSWNEVISGRMEERGIQSFEYLGKPLSVSHVRFNHGRFNIAEAFFLVEGEVFIDRHLCSVHSVGWFTDVYKSALKGNCFALKQIETVVKFKISQKQFGNILWYDRTLFRGLAYAEANRYLELLDGIELPNLNPIGRTAEVARDPSTLLSAIANDEKGVCDPQSLTARMQILSHLVDLGGLLKQLEHYISNQNFTAAQLSFLSHYSFYKARSENGRLKISPLKRFGEAMDRLLTPEFLENRMFIDDARESDLGRILKAVREAYENDFYTAQEREERVAARRIQSMPQ